MKPEAERYRKLPGHRRGILRGASLWLGSDHLLSVKSLRFREEYKRFYLRDVQAIVVARCPRFHLSTRSIAIACLWVLVFLSTRLLAAWVPAAMWSIALCLVGSWFYFSYARSCRCRIFTAVSSDELTSIYRSWTARNLLEEIEPKIRETQGVLEGDWAEALDSRSIGPIGSIRPAPVAGAPGDPLADAAGQAVTMAAPLLPNRTWLSDIFVASLFANAAVNLATLHSLTRTFQWIWYVLAVVQVGGAIGIFVQRHRGLVKSGMQKLVIATLMSMGVSYYLRQVVEGVSKASGPLLDGVGDLPAYGQIRVVDAAVCVGLGIIGIVLSVSKRV